ncbi:MAG: hypothetical protein GC156_14800 [Actinomycetales bacterium]|nr:hypothetical protein [Actinomycetales bacterium]
MAVAASLTNGAAIASASPVAGHTDKKPLAISIVEPAAHQVVTDPVMPVTVRWSGFTLDARYAGTPLIPGVGHFHTIIDGHLIDMSPSVRNGNKDTISMVGLEPGEHVLTVVPAWNDHSEVSAAAVSVSFTYAGPFLPEPAGYSGPEAPTIALVGPASGSTVHGSSFTLTADIQNFVLCGDCYGKANVDGEGHWHIFVDLPMDAKTPMDMMPHMVTMASDVTQGVSLKGLTEGQHTFTALLVGNDHMPLMSMPMASVTVNVDR